MIIFQTSPKKVAFKNLKLYHVGSGCLKSMISVADLIIDLGVSDLEISKTWDRIIAIHRFEFWMFFFKDGN